MPTVAHQFADYIGAVASAEFRLVACREWRPRDLGEHAPPKMLKRGPDLPLAVQFTARA